MNPRILSSLALVALAPLPLSAELVGAYWSFQVGPGDPEAGIFSEAVSYETLAGTPTFARTGDTLADYASLGGDFTHFGGVTWARGESTTWVAANAGSTNNTFQVTIDTTGVENLGAQFRYRNNGLASGGTPINALEAFDYRIGSGPFQPVPGANLTFTNEAVPENFWTMDLSSLDAIEDAGQITLRWTIPDFDQAAGAQLRVDDLQVTGTTIEIPAAPIPGAHWAFQAGPTAPDDDTYTEAVSFETFPGVPTFARTGDGLFSFTNFGNEFTNFNGELWSLGRTATWSAHAGPSTNNTFEASFDSTGSENFSVRFKYRNNGLSSGGSLITALAAFDYRIGTGGFQPVPGVDLTFINDGNYNNIWTADLSALDAIEDAGEVTLRWTIPDYDGLTGTQLRLDDLQVTGSWKPTDPPQRDRLLPEGNYNVLFIPIDDLRPLLDVYGETEPLRPITPNLDRLAAAGMVFTNAHCQQAVCNASRASMLTGLRPDSTRCWKLQTFFRDIHPNVVTIPQHFGTQGYTAHGIGKIYHSTNYTNQDGPLSWNDGWASSNTGHTWYETAKAAAEDGGNNKVSATDAGEVDRQGDPITDDAYNDGFAAAQGVTKIGTYAAAYQSSGTPFFLAVGFQKPHLPFNCPKTYWDLYDPAQIDLAGYDGAQTMPAGTNRFTAPYGGEPKNFDDVTGHPVTEMPTATEARHLIHGYLACVSFIDAQVGKLLDALEDPDGNPGTNDSIVDDTIVVAWSDHGFHLGDHNGFWAKHSNYEIATRVPLIVSAPGMDGLGSAGTFCSAPVELVDVFPTLVDACSLPAPAQPAGLEMQGTSFLPLLEDPAQPWKKGAFSQYQRNINANGAGDIPVGSSGPGMGYSIRTDRYRYTEWWRTASTDDTLDLHVLTGSAPAHVELYDYLADPGETSNLASDPAYATLMADLAACLNDGDGTYAGDGWQSAAVDAPAEFPIDYAAWRTGYENPGFLAGALDPGEDPDLDGIQNLFEYKFGSHPLEANPSPVTCGQGPAGCTLTFPDVTARSDATLEPTTSSNLAPESWTTTGVVLDNDLGPSGNATLRSGTIPATQATGFLRLEATQNP